MQRNIYYRPLDGPESQDAAEGPKNPKTSRAPWSLPPSTTTPTGFFLVGLSRRFLEVANRENYFRDSHLAGETDRLVAETLPVLDGLEADAGFDRWRYRRELAMFREHRSVLGIGCDLPDLGTLRSIARGYARALACLSAGLRDEAVLGCSRAVLAHRGSVNQFCVGAEKSV